MKKKTRKKKRLTLAEQLRKVMVDSGTSHYRIWKDTGISQPVITRFVNEDRNISIVTADKLAEYFGLELRPKRK